MSDTFCSVKEKLTSPYSFFFFIVFVILAAFIFFNWFILKRAKSNLFKRGVVTVSIISVFFFGVLSLFGWMLLEEYYNTPIAGGYFDLNAAIKNTCFLDPLKRNCPKNVAGLINIEDKNFTELTRGKFLRYVYYPETNTYTLIVKDNAHQAAIFDPRLEEGYGRDFLDVHVQGCGANFKVVDPPSFSGPWNP